MRINKGRCHLELWEPTYYNHVSDTAFTGYAARTEQLNEVARRLAKADDPNDFATQCAIYDAVGIDSDTFTKYEINYIVERIAEEMIK